MLDGASRRDKKVWNDIVETTNSQYSVLLDFHKHLKHYLKPVDRNRKIDVLMWDTRDLNNFFYQLDGALVSAQNHSLEKEQMVRALSLNAAPDKEKLQLCNFGLKSPMLKGLNTAAAAYRKLILSFWE